jgi:RNA polymerase sigma factor (sigma-70 family)
MKNENDTFRAAQKDSSLRERFLMSKQSLVKGVCYQYCGRYDDDLIQEGNIGLMVAFEKFNPDLGFKFNTYARQWVFAHIQMANYKKPVVRMGRRERAKRLQENKETLLPILSFNYGEDDNIDVPSGELSMEASLIQKEKQQLVQESLGSIKNPRNKEMVIEYYGLDGGDETKVTLVTLAQKHSISRQRSQQIMTACLSKMKAYIDS